MVHKKYIKRGNRVFGPYLYENYRVGGLTKTRYLGKAKGFGSKISKKGKKKNLWVNKKFFVGVGIFSLVVLTLLSYSLFYSGLTGRATLDVAPSYVLGENLTGALKIGLKSGEFLPIDSKIVIEYGDFFKEILLKEIVDSNFEGDFYVEGSELVGFGQGYGFVGVREIYPEVFFTLNVLDAGGEEIEEEIIVEDSGGSSGGEVEEEVVEELEEEVEEESESILQEETETMPVEDEEEVEESESLEDVEEIVEENEDVLVESEQESDEEASESSDSVESGEESESVSEETSENSESEVVEFDESSDESGAIITGEVVKEKKSKSVDGICSKESDFVYLLEGGKTASIKKGSVKVETLKKGKVKKEKVSNSSITLQISGDEARVSTEYSIVEEGFGEEFLQDEKNVLEIDFDGLGILAEEGNLVVKIVYDEIILAEASEEISVEGPVIEINETIPELNETIPVEVPNETIDLNDNISTIQYGAVLGRPVKWKKSIQLDEPRDVKVEIPKEATNVAVYKLNEVSDEEVIGELLEEVSGEEEIVQNETEVVTEAEKKTKVKKQKKAKKLSKRQKINAHVVSGRVSVDIEVGEGSFIVNFFKKIFSTFTGRVVEIQDTEEIKEVVIEENATEFEIEYETPAPVANEVETGYGKEIVVSSEVHYEDILAYTELPYAVHESNIQLYRIVNGARVAVDFVGYSAEAVVQNKTQVAEILQNETQAENIEEVKTKESLSITG